MIEEYIIETCQPGGEWHHADPMEIFSSAENATLNAEWLYCYNRHGVGFGVRISKVTIAPVKVLREVPRE